MAQTPLWEADEAVTQMYVVHYRSLVKMAALLVRHSGEAEEIVQDAFVAMHDKWHRLREPDKALAYLRQAVVNRARSSQRHHVVADRHAPQPVLDSAGPEDLAAAAETRAAVMAALHRLPTRQREVLVLRYYSDLSEAEIATTLGISRGAVKSHASRGIGALRGKLEGADR
jgi:RNA polymerase sigma-70 factor (sigma-E family)